MGLKSGSRDAGLDESGDETDQTNKETSSKAPAAHDAEPDKKETDAPPSDAATEAEDDTPEETETETQRPTMNSIPYKLRRDKVNEGREQVPYFLRKEIIEAEPELQDTLEDFLGENVYKSDYREAAMVVAQRNPELVADVLREWGYDLKTA
jgi:flagellar biosynthesis/type III secretory pathway M-ring protein FliF/YscJ